MQELAEDAKGESLLLREVLKLVPALLGQAAPPLSHAGWQIRSLSLKYRQVRDGKSASQDRGRAGTAHMR